MALQQHSPLSRKFYPSENWLSSSCLTSVITRELVFPSWYQPLTLSSVSYYSQIKLFFSGTSLRLCPPPWSGCSPGSSAPSAPPSPTSPPQTWSGNTSCPPRPRTRCRISRWRLQRTMSAQAASSSGADTRAASPLTAVCACRSHRKFRTGEFATPWSQLLGPLIGPELIAGTHPPCTTWLGYCPALPTCIFTYINIYRKKNAGIL